MATVERRLRLPGELDQVRAACDFVVQVAEDAGLDERGVFQCQLSVEEIFTNIVEHGYEYQGSDKSIEIVCRYNREKLLITIMDEAPPFNPLALETPDATADLWSRGDGGWGVFFVRQYMDDIRYQYEDRNCLILEKKILADQLPGSG
jgi:serine/threonine-protein kinase RsbW